MHPRLDIVRGVSGSPDEASCKLLDQTAKRLGHAPRLGHHLRALRHRHCRIALQHVVDESRNSIQNGNYKQLMDRG